MQRYGAPRFAVEFKTSFSQLYSLYLVLYFRRLLHGLASQCAAHVSPDVECVMVSASRSARPKQGSQAAPMFILLQETKAPDKHCLLA